MLNSPGFLMQKAVQRLNYNMGRLYKEAGLGKSLSYLLTGNFFT